ncbi:MAG: hypothetical protein WC516_09735 [Patescibacteria group bacterium]|jgi:hypothetical protein
MRWTEVIKNYPIIQSKYKRKLAAKRRMKAQSGLDETMTAKDMNQISIDIIKTMKENLPADIEKPQTYDDVIRGLKEGNTAELLGFKSQDLSPRADDTVETQDINYEEQPVEETVTEEVATEEVPTNQPQVPQPNIVEEDLTTSVGNLGKRIADEFKPLTPMVGPINAPIPAPMPQPYSQTINKPVPNKSPSLGGVSFWGDTKFW